MKISIDWLGEHLNLSEYTDSEISDLLTFSGIEVEDIIKFPDKIIVSSSSVNCLLLLSLLVLPLLLTS